MTGPYSPRFHFVLMIPLTTWALVHYKQNNSVTVHQSAGSMQRRQTVVFSGLTLHAVICIQIKGHLTAT